MNICRHIVLLAALALLAGCVANSTQNRLGMVRDPETGLAFGSVIEKNLIVDSSFYSNRKLKVRIRNTSGDTAFDLHGFKSQLERAYADKGYQPTDADDFRLLVDVNVVYSGQVRRDLASEFGFLGAAAGGVAGAASRGGGVATAGGVVAGATLGTIAGSFVTEETYIIVARVTFGEIKEVIHSKKSLTFSNSVRLKDLDEQEEDKTKIQKRDFRDRISTGVSVFAGGTNTSQAEIAAQVRSRIIRIVGDFI